MPDRIIRAELLDSEAWLALKDNADRVCWIALFLTADVFGDLPAGPLRLLRLWRPFGIDSSEKVAKVKTELADVDFIRLYDIESKPYLHLPRFNQSRRWLGKVWPLSPWATIEDKQRLGIIPPEERGGPPYGVGLGVGIGVDKKRSSNHEPVDKLPHVTFVQHWTAKAKSIGIEAKPGEKPGEFAKRVQQAFKAHNHQP